VAVVRTNGTDTIVAKGTGNVDIGLNSFGVNSGIETIDGTGVTGKVTIIGDWSDNKLDFSNTAFVGDNIQIHGYWGNDNITGTTGNDVIIGGGGEDKTVLSSTPLMKSVKAQTKTKSSISILVLILLTSLASMPTPSMLVIRVSRLLVPRIFQVKRDNCALTAVSFAGISTAMQSATFNWRWLECIVYLLPI